MPKKRKINQLSEIINWGFPLKWGTMNQSFLFFELIGVFIVHWLILEPQTYIVVEQFGAESIPLLSGRLVAHWIHLEINALEKLGLTAPDRPPQR